MKCIILILFIEYSIIFSRLIPSNNLTSALEEASPGDVIELQYGKYSYAPYKFVSGEKDKPIIIKAFWGAQVTFSGNDNSCIFDLNDKSYITIEGPFDLKDSLCGIKATNSSNIKISGLKIHNMKQQGIIISGENNKVANNEIYDCVTENKNKAKTLTYGWKQCISVLGKKNNSYFSKDITFKNNYIHNSWGEGLYFHKCDGCYSISNNITNTFSMNLYIHSSKNIIIEGNIIRINSNDYDSHLGNACGIAFTSESSNENIVDNITIKNNIILGTRIGIYFFQTGSSGYSKVKILHNTIWYISVSPLWIEKPINIPSDCELRNNLIYIEGWIADFYPKKSWTIGSNYYYNYGKIPNEYSDTVEKSKYVKNLDFDKIFNNKNGDCNYISKNLDIECLRPSTSPDNSFNLFHGGSSSNNIVDKDIAGCDRSNNNPTIGAFEYYLKCSDNYIVDELKIQFKIQYCANQGELIKMIGDPWNWNHIYSPTFSYIGDCFWSYTFETIKEDFEYKFVISNGFIVYRWENDPNRVFNIFELANAIKNNNFGYYENCNYYKEGNLVTLTCYWKG